MLELNDKKLYDEYLKTLEGDVVLTVKKPEKPRSNAENRYYWHCIVEVLAKELFGDGPEAKKEMHDALREKFLGRHTEQGLRLIQSTTSLCTVQFEQYLKEIREWASADLHIYLPLPNEAEY